jgi:hypothetical protein
LRQHHAKLAALAAAAIVPYVAFFGLPIISDTYIQIFLARQFGPLSGWDELLSDVLYRCRATSLVFTYVVDALFGASEVAHRAANIGVHVFNTWLVFWLGRWKLIGYRISLPAALFFALYEGHQEAVVWVAALPELLVFSFCLLCLHAWIEWIGGISNGAGRQMRWLWLSAAAFLLALLSKESAVAVVPVLALVSWRSGALRASSWPLGGLAAASVAYAAAIFVAHKNHLHLNDGTFALDAPFWLTVPVSIGRMLWFWGAAAVAVLALVKAWQRQRRLLELVIAWTVCTLLPYGFLTYMTRVPSRHTYLASMGLALLAGAAFAAFQEVNRTRWFAPALLALFAVHNCGYLWVKKLPQYERRAAVTERFLEFARQTEGPVYLQCGAYGQDVYRYAAHLRLGRPLDFVRPVNSAGAPPSSVYCDPVHP